jgi:hypothetical protein
MAPAFKLGPTDNALPFSFKKFFNNGTDKRHVGRW